MTTITVQLDDAKAEALRRRAEDLGLLPDQLLTASVEDLISQADPDFEEAAKRILAKNQELYQRLS